MNLPRARFGLVVGAFIVACTSSAESPDAAPVTPYTFREAVSACSPLVHAWAPDAVLATFDATFIRPDGRTDPNVVDSDWFLVFHAASQVHQEFYCWAGRGQNIPGVHGYSVDDPRPGYTFSLDDPLTVALGKWGLTTDSTDWAAALGLEADAAVTAIQLDPWLLDCSKYYGTCPAENGALMVDLLELYPTYRVITLPAR